MKYLKPLMFTFLASVLIACETRDHKTKILTIDINTDYPKKELILQDFMNVEYIPLETNDEFITQGDVMAIGEKYILVKNWSNDGDIFIFDRKSGKGLRKINRKGQGAEEYTFINGIVLDEDNNEMFVNCTPMKKIFVYDLLGNFKRYFNHTEGSEYLDIFNYDKDNLIRYDMSLYYKEGKSREDKSYHAIISKQDGRVTRNIPIPFDIIKAPFVQKGDGIAVASVRPIIGCQGNWLLVETSSDTVYNYISTENRLSPLFVKTSSSNPETLVTMGVITNQYYFIQTIEKTFDFTTGRGFPTTDIIYDKQENAIYNVSVFNNDYLTKQKVDMMSHPINSKIATFQTLAAYKLVDAYKKDKLKGKLKEIASKLNEESNPVIMVMHNK